MNVKETLNWMGLLEFDPASRWSWSFETLAASLGTSKIPENLASIHGIYFNSASILAERTRSHMAYPVLFKWASSARCILRSMSAGIGSQSTFSIPSFSFSFLIISTRSALLFATCPGCMSRRSKIPQTRILVSSLDFEKIAYSRERISTASPRETNRTLEFPVTVDLSFSNSLGWYSAVYWWRISQRTLELSLARRMEGL